MSDKAPIRAWTLPPNRMGDLVILSAAINRALHRAETQPRNRAYFRCKRWHKRWRSDIYISDGHPYLDCARCGLRWIW